MDQRGLQEKAEELRFLLKRIRNVRANNFLLEFSPISFARWYHPSQRDWVEVQYIARFGNPVSTERRCYECYVGIRYTYENDGDEVYSYECDACDGTGRMMKPTEEILEEYARTLYNKFVADDYAALNLFLKEQAPKYAV